MLILYTVVDYSLSIRVGVGLDEGRRGVFNFSLAFHRETDLTQLER